MNNTDPHNLVGNLVGFDVPASDGGDYGLRVIRYDPETEDYYALPIKFSTGAVIGEERDIDAFKITYRYDLKAKRQS